MTDEDEDYQNRSLLPNLQRHRLSVTPDPTPISNYYRVKRSSSNVGSRGTTPSKLDLGPTLSNSSSELSTTFSSTRYLDIPSNTGVAWSGSHKSRRHRRRSHASTPSSPNASTFHLPPIDGHIRSSQSPSGSPTMYRRKQNYHPLNFIEARTVHFEN